MNLALQLFTIRNIAQADLAGTLKQLAEMGYDAVEFAGFYGHPREEVAEMLQEAGLKAVGMHVGLDQMEQDFAEIAADARAVGAEALLVPHVGHDAGRSYGHWETVAMRMKAMAGMCRVEGLDFGFHLHGPEFDELEGGRGIDAILKMTEPDEVAFELDTYWVEKAGTESVELAAAHGERVRYVHVKDYDNRENWHDVEAGSGCVKIPELIETARNVRWWVVEQEAFVCPEMEAVAMAAKQMRGLLGG